MKNFTFLALFVFSILGISSCQDPIEDFNPNQETETAELIDIAFQFVITHDSNAIDSTASNFDWENFDYTQVYIDYNNGATVAQNLTLPWKTQGNPLNLVDPKIYKSDGFELVTANLGSAESPVERPYFSLYNKEKRTFYLFVHNTRWQSASYAVGNLVLNSDDPESRISLFSKQAEFPQYDSWFNFEYEIPEAQSEAFANDSDWVLMGTGIKITYITPTN